MMISLFCRSLFRKRALESTKRDLQYAPNAAMVAPSASSVITSLIRCSDDDNITPVYIYVYMYTHVYEEYKYIYMCICKYVYICTYVYIYVYMYMYM